MMTFLVKYVWLFAGLTLATGTHVTGEYPQNQAMTLMIDRKVKNNECMRGYLMTKSSGEKEAKVQCLVLETPPRGSTSAINGIPAGSYKVKVKAEGDRGWRLEIMGVSGKSVFMRLGNCPENTTNCLLPGTKAGHTVCEVDETDAAMKVLKDVFQTFGTSAETTITIR